MIRNGAQFCEFNLQYTILGLLVWLASNQPIIISGRPLVSIAALFGIPSIAIFGSEKTSASRG